MSTIDSRFVDAQTVVAVGLSSPASNASTNTLAQKVQSDWKALQDSYKSSPTSQATKDAAVAYAKDYWNLCVAEHAQESDLEAINQGLSEAQQDLGPDHTGLTGDDIVQFSNDDIAYQTNSVLNPQNPLTGDPFLHYAGANHSVTGGVINIVTTPEPDGLVAESTSSDTVTQPNSLPDQTS